MITCFAPASMCLEAASSLVKTPVHSNTTSTPLSFQGKRAGSRWSYTFIRLPLSLIQYWPPVSCPYSTSPLKRPLTLSNFISSTKSLRPSIPLLLKLNAISFIATTSTFFSGSSAQILSVVAPILPAPFIATLVGVANLFNSRCLSESAFKPLNSSPPRICSGTPPPENKLTPSSRANPYLLAVELASPPITTIRTPRLANSVSLFNTISVPFWYLQLFSSIQPIVPLRRTTWPFCNVSNFCKNFSIVWGPIS